MSAAALIFLILGLIAIGMAFYYFVICYQAHRPGSRNKLPSHSDMGPLLVYEEDYNGNHEEPVSERVCRVIDEPDASAPKPENMEDMASAAGIGSGLETPLKSVTFQMTPECASKNPSNEGSVILSIDELPHLDTSKSVLPNPHERSKTLVEVAKQPHHNGNDPLNSLAIPLTLSDTPQKAMSVSYEEDGLLVQEPPQQQENRRVLGRQKSAPAGPIPYSPPMFIQSNPRQIKVLSPHNSIPQMVMGTDGSVSYHRRIPFRPALKSNYSDPGTEKERVFVFQVKHPVEETSEQPVKKRKMTFNEEIDQESRESSRNRTIEDASANNDGGHSVGWLPSLAPRDPKAGFVAYQEVVVQKTEQNEDSDNICESDQPSTKQVSSEKESPENKSVSLNVDSDNDDPDVVTSSPVRVKIIFPNEVEVQKSIEVSDNAEDFPEEDESSSSDPDITKYYFQRDSSTPDPAVASVLLNEVSSCLDKIEITNYANLPEDASGNPKSQPPKDRDYKIEGHPPTPTSDTTKSISPISSNDNSLDEINAPSFSLNVLGTPPTTPPPEDNLTTSADLIIQNPSAEELTDTTPAFIEIETHRSLSSSASASSSLSSTSSSNGSGKIDVVLGDKNNDSVEGNHSSPNLDSKNRLNQM